MAQRRTSPILLTYFEPFGGADFNASSIITDLQGDSSLPNIEFMVLPVSFANAWPVLKQGLEASPTWSAVLAVGEAGGRKKVALERIAINWLESSLADNEGTQSEGEPLVPGGPEGIMSSLPISQLQRALVGKTPLEIEASNSAGTFVCNSLMYHLLTWARARQIPAGFIHVPAVRPTDSDYLAQRSSLLATLQALLNHLQGWVNSSPQNRGS